MANEKPRDPRPFRPWERLLINLVGILGRLLIRSLRVRLVDIEHYLRFREQGQPVIFVVWHSRLLLAMLPARIFGVATLASPTRDGQIGAEVARRLGVESVAGDARYRGTAALRQLARLLRQGRDLGLFPDGPLGPARRMKIGPLILARQAGCPVFPVGLDAAWKLRIPTGWDEMIFPLPFSRVVAMTGEPVFVSEDAMAGDLEQLATKLEVRIDELNRRAGALCQSGPQA